MKENEHRLIKDLYSHYKPDTVVDDELITNCYKQYGSIRGVLMNLIFKFEPNSEVDEAYIDAKLKAYGIIVDVQKVDETENSSDIVDENKQVKEPKIQKKESLGSVSDNKEIKQSVHPEENNMKENEHRLIKDLYSHYKPDTVVDDELITNCYKQYGSIRGVLMNLIFKFEPNSEVNAAYIDAKLKAYRIIEDIQESGETENSSVLVDENKQVKEPQIQKKESLSSVSDNKEIKQSVRPEETKNESKNQWLRYLILIIIGVSLGIGSFIVYQNYSSSNAVAEVIEEEVIINYHYVISSKLHLCEAPGEKSIQLLEMPFGTPVELLGDETKIEEYTYQRARVNGTNGWVSTKKHEILLINSADKLSEIHDIINGPGDQQVLESMPSYAKYTLLEIEKTANYRGVQVKIDDTDGYSEIKFFRSKEANRNSSSDKRKGINNGLKDMAVIVTYPDYSNSVLFVSFSKTYKWNIVLEVPIEDYSVIGLERLKRRSSIQSQGLEIVNSIKFDAIAIRTDNGTDKYIYGAEGRLEEVLPPSYSQQFYKIEDPDGWSNLRDSPNRERVGLGALKL